MNSHHNKDMNNKETYNFCHCGSADKCLKDTAINGCWHSNPIAIQLLGICSALAVTNKLENALVMGSAVTFVTGMSCLIVSIIRDITPKRVRLMAEMAIIASFVIIFDRILKAYYWEMSKQLGPYIGLIITNCIVMGRAEAFAMRNRPLVSLVDGLANGIGYSSFLILIAIIREVFGTGNLLGHNILSTDWYMQNHLLSMAPGAFILLGLLVAGFNFIKQQRT